MENKLKTLVKEISKQKNEPEWMLKRREYSFKLFEKFSFPKFKYGMSVNMDVEIDFDNIFPGKGNGMKISNEEDIIVEDFDTALKNNPSIIKKYFMNVVKPQDKITALHYSLRNRGIFIHVKKGKEVEMPLSTIMDISGNTFDSILLIMEPMSKLNIVETVASKNNANFRSETVEVILKQGAELNFINVQNLSQNVYNFSSKNAILDRDSNIKWIDCCFGSSFTKLNISTILDGEGARTDTYSMFFTSKNQQYDIYVSAFHIAPHTISDLQAKGALTDSSKAIYQGMIKIGENAFGSNGYQKNDNLLLSDDAVVDSIPNLEIDNNDVKCSHGASTGKVDKEKLFYLMTRGLNEKEATKKLVEGFFYPIISKIPIEEIRKDIEMKIAGFSW